MAKLGRLWVVAALLAAALGIAGCGGGSESSTSTSGSTAPPPGASGEASKGSGNETTPSSGEGQAHAKGSGEAPAGKPKPPPAGPSQQKGPQKSLETFGANAEGAARAAVVGAFHSYLGDIAAGRFKHVCDKLLTAGNREQLNAYLNATSKVPKECPEMLGSVLKSQGKNARAAAAGTIQKVRKQGNNAIIVFTPRGGTLSYFAMTREGGTWRVISLTTGTPIGPHGP